MAFNSESTKIITCIYYTENNIGLFENYHKTHIVTCSVQWIVRNLVILFGEKSLV